MAAFLVETADRRIVEQVSRTHREVPAVTFVEECDFTGTELRTIVARTLQACALALREFPRANGAYRDGRIELYSRVNVGVAVAAQDALVVPTIGNDPELAAKRNRPGKPPTGNGGSHTALDDPGKR